MTVGSKEFYDVLAQFEQTYKYKKLTREDKSLWSRGQVYENGAINELYKAFAAGYANGRLAYM